MEGVLSALILLFILVSIWAFTTWRKLKDMEKLKEWVTWSVHEDDFVRYNIPLWVHLRDAQIRAAICDEYRITEEEEWASAKEIIGRYQKQLLQSYFDGKLWVVRSAYDINGKDYFLFMLYVFLCEHDVSSSDVVYYKMQYITYVYCKKNLALQKNVPAWQEGRLKETLDDLLKRE